MKKPLTEVNKMIEFDHDPGYIKGHVVVKKVRRVTKQRTYIKDYTWELVDYDNESRMKKQTVPIYGKGPEYVENECTWQVYTVEEYIKLKENKYKGTIHTI